MNIAVVGAGYVGLSLSVLLAQNHKVKILDIVDDKVNLINQRKSTVIDKDIDYFFANKYLRLSATLNEVDALLEADYVIIATPTNYDEEKNYFDTSSVERTIVMVKAVNPNAIIVIKSTVPVGFTREIKARLSVENVIFSPEFLREGKALYDNLYPSRIIVGEESEIGRKFAKILAEGAIKKDIPQLFMSSNEAEAVKLFANTYLAMRVTFFNELDTYAELRGLDSKSIIEGVSYDPRIGHYYNNPSFGYGGYCLPKDTKQLLANYKDVPNNLIKAIVDGNKTRKDHIAEMILRKCPEVVGVYRVTMKKDSDNFRESSIQGIMRRLKENNIRVVLYEPGIYEDYFQSYEVINDIREFKRESDLIITNRYEEELKDVTDKIYTRDIFSRD